MPKLRLTTEQIAGRVQALELAATWLREKARQDLANQTDRTEAAKQITEFAIEWADTQLSREPLIV